MKRKLTVVVVVLCLVVGAEAGVHAATSGTIDESFIGIEDATDSVEIYISSKSSPSILTPFTLNGQHLSPACGDGFFRCKLFAKLRILDGMHYYVIVIPLVQKLIILELLHDGKEMSLHGRYILETGCNSTGLIEIQGLHYTICIGRNSISVYQVLLNSASIEDSSIADQAAVEIAFPSLNPSELSNFEYVNMGNNLQRIYFSVGQHLHALNPIDNTNMLVGSIGCSVVDLLVYAGNQVLVANCRNDSVVYFDTDYGRWYNHTDPIHDEYPFPYVCHNPDVHLAVSSVRHSMEYGVWSQNKLRRIDLPGREIQLISGVCFDIGGSTLFAFADKQEGVFVMNISLSHDTATKLSSFGCPDSMCRPLVFGNRYIIVREQSDDRHVTLVSDSFANFTVIMQLAVRADLVSLVEVTPEEKDTSSIGGTAIAVIAIFTTLFIASLVLAAAAAVYMYRRSASEQDLVTAETSFNEEDSENSSIESADTSTLNQDENIDSENADLTETDAQEQSDHSEDDPPTRDRTLYNVDGSSSEQLPGIQPTGPRECTEDHPQQLQSDGHAYVYRSPRLVGVEGPPSEPIQQTPNTEGSVTPNSEHNAMGTRHPYSEQASTSALVPLDDVIGNGLPRSEHTASGTDDYLVAF